MRDVGGQAGEPAEPPRDGGCSPFSHPSVVGNRSGAEGVTQLPCLTLSMFGPSKQMLGEEPGTPHQSDLYHLPKGPQNGSCRPVQGTTTSTDSMIPQNSQGPEGQCGGALDSQKKGRRGKWLEAGTAGKKPVECWGDQTRVLRSVCRCPKD